jgi:serine/threonine protein kinase
LLREKATFTNKVDIWNLGTVIYELIALRPLFDNDFRVQEYDRNPEKMATIFEWAEFPVEGVFEKSREFILSRLLEVNHENRLSAYSCARDLQFFFVKGGVAFIDDLLQFGAPALSPDGAEFIRVWKWLPRYLDLASSLSVRTDKYNPFVSYVELILAPKWDHLDRRAFSLRVDDLTFGLPFKSSAKFWKG